MGVLNLCMKKNPFSRTFHFILLVPCILIVVLAATSLATFVPLHLEIKDYDSNRADGSAAGASETKSGIGTCILFASTDNREQEVRYREDNSCDFMIWGQVAVGSLAVTIGAVLIIKAFIGTKV